VAKVDLSRCRLYAILDLGYVEPPKALEVASELLEGGAELLQLRAKGLPPAEVSELAGELHRLTSQANVPLIINDYPEIARSIGAEGVHLGQEDAAIAEARRVQGMDRIIGQSTHGISQAQEAARQGADYIGFGPLFATPTKPNYSPIGLGDISEVHKLVSLPIFCIGGINSTNLAQVRAAGAQRVVIVSGLLQAPDVKQATRLAKAMLVV
jgi:thiamine-phosphate pyrophosphorylase